MESYDMPRRLPLAKRSALIQKLALLEGRLFDKEDRVHRDVSEEVAGARLNEINGLRHDLGWLQLDLGHHHIWPAEMVSSD
jgi:hypothetical protein